MSLLRRTRGLELELRSRRVRRGSCGVARRAAVASRPTEHGGSGVHVERLGTDGAAVRLAGELDLAALGALEAALRRTERWSSSSVLVDAADVGFVDLVCIRRLAGAHERLAKAGGGLLVVHPPDCLLRMLELVDGLELPVLR